MNARFEELKAKGYKNLNGPEREEYSQYKADSDAMQTDEDKASEQLNTQDEKPVVTDGVTDPSTVVVERGMLENLIARLDQLEKSNRSLEATAGLSSVGQWQESKTVERKHTATLRKYRSSSEKPFMFAIDWKHLMDRYDEVKKELQQIYKIKFIVEGTNEIIELNMTLSDFVKIVDREVVTIVERTVKPQEMTVGFVREKNVEFKNHDDFEITMGRRVPLKVTRNDVEVRVRFSNGSELAMREDRLNA